MTATLQITLALIGLIVIISVCIPVWKKSRSERDKLKYQRPSQNSIKNFDLEIKLQSDSDDEGLNQLDLPISEENETQLTLFEEVLSGDEKDQSEAYTFTESNIVCQLFIKPNAESPFLGKEIKRVLEGHGMAVSGLPAFSKKLKIRTQESLTINIADMYEPGSIELQTIEDRKFLGLVVFAHLDFFNDYESLLVFFKFCCEISALLQGSLFFGKRKLSESDFELYKSMLEE